MRYNEFKLTETHTSGAPMPADNDIEAWGEYFADLGASTSSGVKRVLPKPEGTYTKSPEPKKPSKYTTPGKNIGSYADWGITGYADAHGWNVDGGEEEAKKIKTSIGKVAKDYGVEPRAFTANQQGSMKLSKNQSDHRVGAGQSMTYAKHNPYMSAVDLTDLEKHMSHELAHHNSMNFAAVDAEGGMRIADPDNIAHKSEHNYITGFGLEDAEGKYLTMANKYISDDGTLDEKGFRQELYKNVFGRKTNKQRPELKHALATTVSYILTDKSLLKHASDNTWLKDEADYQYDPEELWARGFAEFSRMKRLDPKERFRDKDMITPETYNKIQKMMDTIKVKHGNVMTKGRGRDTGTRTS